MSEGACDQSTQLRGSVNLSSNPTQLGISIVIAHYGDPTITEALIERLSAQDTSRAIQIIVSDDASPVPFPYGEGYELVRARSNGGFGACVNRGVATARNPLLLILNSDVVPEVDFVEDFASACEPWLPNALCGPRLTDLKGQGSDPRRFPRKRYYFVEWLGFLARWRGSPRWRRATGSVLVGPSSNASEVDWVVGAAMLLSTDHYRSVGGMDEQFHMYMEEVDLQYRLQSQGVRAVYIPSIQLIHLQGASSPDTEDRLRAILNSRLLYERKWSSRASARELQALLTAATLLDLASDTVRRIRGVSVRPVSQCRQRLGIIWRRPAPYQRIIE